MLCINSFGQKTIVKSSIPVTPISSLELKTEIKGGKNKYSFFSKKKNMYDREYIIIESIKDTITGYDSKDIRLKFGLFFRGKSTGTIEQGSFCKGYKNGFWKTTYKNKLVKTINYKVGLVIGKYIVYNTKGNLLYKTSFGSKGNGIYKDYYYETERLKQEGTYLNGKKEGKWCTYDKQGNLNKIISYKNGEPIS